MKRWTIPCSCVLLAGHAALAIEAPKPDSADSPAAAPAPQAQLAPSDEAAFYAVLQSSAHHRNLTGLKVPADVQSSLARGDAAAAVAALSAAAAANRNDENIALVRIQHWCNRISSSRTADAKAQIAKLPADLAPQRAARAAGVIIAEEEYLRTARSSCAQAQFDYGGIEQRLRAATQGGDPASATELAQFTRDPAQRKSLLKTAADKNFAPAQYVLATSHLMSVQRGDTTEDVSSIRLLLKQAGRSINKAKVDLANCMALGCDGHPADSAAAAAFGMDAARDGEPSAFVSMARMPWGGRIPRVQLLAWQYFGDRLSEAGCVGDAYVMSTITFDQTLKAFEQRLDQTMIEQARAQAERLWQDNGERAKREQGCQLSAASG